MRIIGGAQAPPGACLPLSYGQFAIAGALLTSRSITAVNFSSTRTAFISSGIGFPGPQGRIPGIERVNMRRQNAEGFRSRCVRWFRAMGLTFNGILLVTASSHAGFINASWTAPTTNTGGSSLALYRVYYSTSALPCPGRSFVQIAASTSIRSPNQTVSFQLTGLTTGSTYSVSVTAVYRDGKESACSAIASVVAQPDIAVTPTGPVSFGTV